MDTDALIDGGNFGKMYDVVESSRGDMSPRSFKEHEAKAVAKHVVATLTARIAAEGEAPGEEAPENI